ncbi:uncharacterized protein LOC132544463 [Ylistrum balloti]|uniref:uncharacterized protein LOC132544463 n=1 Tax=Ylistrum balloti TaxID=509963 RepID=UPI002905DA40|nr:uncharacterized protein LOC132544463 [Ylistrum balloti]
MEKLKMFTAICVLLVLVSHVPTQCARPEDGFTNPKNSRRIQKRYSDEDYISAYQNIRKGIPNDVLLRNGGKGIPNDVLLRNGGKGIPKDVLLRNGGNGILKLDSFLDLLLAVIAWAISNKYEF